MKVPPFAKHRILTAASALIAGSFLLTACAPGAGESAANADGNATLVVYSNSVSDGRGAWLTAQAAQAGFDLELVDLGGGDVMNRLTAEKNNPIADVTFGMNNVYFEKLKAQDVLEPYTPAWSAEVDSAMGDEEDKTFWPIVREPIMLVYNEGAYPSADAAPRDWTDLWTKDQFKGRYEVPGASTGATTQMVYSGILARYADPKGELGISKEGWDQMAAYFEHGSTAVKGEDLYARMKAGTVDAGQMWLAGKNSREAEYGVATKAVQPEVGVPFAVQHVAMVKGTDQAEAAQDFIDWFGSAKVQAAWSNEFFTAPTNTQALADANKQAIEQTEAFTPQDIDWALVAENIDAWVEKIELEYRK
ncbi:extracellular solute-binding protein [Pseudarthrobacter sp. NIBRBAC000502772]|uniref:extracellular solute-binding protein n=1 Tax=Pseudarthrobacter sp. NIBRBAC000502772 TaxID=2590775 RepID=UPI00113014B1|nr:extracellular solute-binding protein [Pseudarthrobacter sp. NIBRBAC000502772]QDG66039.1 extracellular solute-binding protein [Pseudarthrobacter sp. NIBRBAC000502772]